MFAKSVIALATVASFAFAAPVEKRGAPAGWAYGYLEDYETCKFLLSIRFHIISR